MPPRLNFENFRKCCEERPSMVQFFHGVTRDAQRDFGLESEKDIRNFIVDGGLDEKVFYKEDLFRIGKDATGKTMPVDVYDFWTLEKFGYFAYVQNPENACWLIKSFKLNEKADPRKSGAGEGKTLEMKEK